MPTSVSWHVRSRPPFLDVTRSQLRALRAISALSARGGSTPSFLEVGRYLGITEASAFLLVSRLTRRGLLRHTRGGPRPHGVPCAGRAVIERSVQP